MQTVANALIVRASDEQAAVLAGLPGVVRVTPVQEYKLVLDRAVQLQKVTEAWALSGGIGAAGAGIRIGIIDTGIDSSHPGFQDDSLAPIGPLRNLGNLPPQSG